MRVTTLPTGIVRIVRRCETLHGQHTLYKSLQCRHIAIANNCTAQKVDWY